MFKLDCFGLDMLYYKCSLVSVFDLDNIIVLSCRF